MFLDFWISAAVLLLCYVVGAAAAAAAAAAAVQAYRAAMTAGMRLSRSLSAFSFWMKGSSVMTFSSLSTRSWKSTYTYVTKCLNVRLAVVYNKYNATAKPLGCRQLHITLILFGIHIHITYICPSPCRAFSIPAN